MACDGGRDLEQREHRTQCGPCGACAHVIWLPRVRPSPPPHSPSDPLQLTHASSAPLQALRLTYVDHLEKWDPDKKEHVQPISKVVLLHSGKAQPRDGWLDLLKSEAYSAVESWESFSYIGLGETLTNHRDQGLRHHRRS